MYVALTGSLGYVLYLVIELLLSFLQITQGLKWLVRTMSDIETQSVSIERIDEYTHLESEVSLTLQVF